MRGQWRRVRWRVCVGGVCDGNVCDGGVIWAESSLIEDGDTAPSSYGIVHRLATTAALLLPWLALVCFGAFSAVGGSPAVAG
jgi:hypothetical protein